MSSVLLYKAKVDPYLEVLDALQCQEVKTYGNGDSISAMIISLKYSLSFVSDEEEKKELEEIVNGFCTKYIEKIDLILKNSDNIKDDDFEKLEIEMRESIHPTLKRLDLKVQKESNTEDILKSVRRKRYLRSLLCGRKQNRI